MSDNRSAPDYSKMPCFGSMPLRRCNAKGNKCSRGRSASKSARIWASAFETGCGTELYEFDTKDRKFQAPPQLRSTLQHDFGVLATNPVTGLVYGIGVAPLNPPNINCENAELLALNSAVQSNTCTGESIGPVPGDELGQTAGPALWYKLPIFTDEQVGEGDLNVILTTCSPCTNYNTWLILYEGEDCENLTIVNGIFGDLFSNLAKVGNCMGSNPINEGTVTGSIIELMPEANKQYWVAVTGIVQTIPPASAGQFELFFYEGDLFTPNPLVGSTTGGLQIFRLEPPSCDPKDIGPCLPCTVGFVYDASFKVASGGCVERCGALSATDTSSQGGLSAADGIAATCLYFFAQNQPNVIEVDSEAIDEGANQYSLYKYNLLTGTLSAITNDFFSDFGTSFEERVERSVGNGLTFDGENRLWLASKKLNIGINDLFGWQHKLYEVDPDNGEVLSDRAISFVGFPPPFADAPAPPPLTNEAQFGPRINALAYDNCSGLIYAFVQDFLPVDAENLRFNSTLGYNGPGNRYLATLDTATATVTFLQQVKIGGQGLAVELLPTQSPCDGSGSALVSQSDNVYNRLRNCTADECCDLLQSLPNFGACKPRLCRMQGRKVQKAIPRLWASENGTQRLLEVAEHQVDASSSCCLRTESLGLENSVLATHPGTGVVYGVGRDPDFDSETALTLEYQLFFIDPDSGAAIIIGGISFPVPFGIVDILDAAFRCSDRQLVDANDALLYLSATEIRDTEDNIADRIVLFAIDTALVQANIVARPFDFPPIQAGGAIAFDACQTLYMINKSADENQSRLYALNSADGSIIDQSLLTYAAGFPDFTVQPSSPFVSAMAYDKCNNVFYVIVVDDSGDGRKAYLGKFDCGGDGSVHYLGEKSSPIKGLTSELLGGFACK